jgi:dTDP-4-amino-4,6-dideoxygalactose transaminase
MNKTSSTGSERTIDSMIRAFGLQHWKSKMGIPFNDLFFMHAEVSDQLDEAWRELSRSSKFIGGEYVERFEAEWAQYCDVDYCVGLGSGTAALELTLRALGIGPGDEVIVPANTFIATASAVAAVGAQVVFVDVDVSTLLITAANVENALTRRTAGVMVVHLYGQPADMDSINRVARAAGIVVIEDAAQAHGATWRGKPVGSLSDAGCFSFYPGKNLGAFGDAGAVVTRDSGLANRIRSMSNHGRPPDSPHLHELIGSNHRLDALQAAILSIKLKRLDAWNAARRRAADRYKALLSGLAVEMVGTVEDACSSHHLTAIQAPHRDKLRRCLAAEGIASGIHYPVPCHRQRAFLTEKTPYLPVVECAADRILSLPMFPNLTDAQIGHVADGVHRALANLEQKEHSRV